MGSIIKNQILKHLSKFTKNLSPDKIQISTMKGEGELSNLELDENILTHLLELPTWMKLTKAVCNKVSVKVQWTKLKSQPFCLYLDEVVLEIETCPDLRPPNNSTESEHKSEGSYGFVDKVVDGIYVHINSVNVQFVSDKFHASLQLSRVTVQSLSPLWSTVSDLRHTRIKNEATNEILIFKEIDWQTTRIEANAREGDDSLPTTPLRLIANQSKIRIVLKKRLSDCSLISSRIIFLLDDLLWVLTDTQLKSAILYADSLSDMIEKSTEQSKQFASEKLQNQNTQSSEANQFYLQQQQQQQRRQGQEAKHFQRFDVLTTSYHLITSRIDLHLCDDSSNEKDLSPKHNPKINGGAMQITFHKVSVDYYPFHYAGGERKNWYRYTDNQGSRNSWVQELFKEFRSEVKKARETCSSVSPSQSPAHNSPFKPGQSSQPRSVVKGQGHANGSSSGQGQTKPKITKLLESCMVLRIEDFIIYRISTADSKRGVAPQKFFSSDKKALHLPADMSMVHMEYTEYFFTEGIDYPVPHANMYVLINPVRLNVDYLTVLWANYFSLNLAQMVENQGEIQKKLEHVDVKIEALMPRLVVPAEEKVENQPDRPESLQIQFSKVTVSNTHVEEQFHVSKLRDILQNYNKSDLFKNNEFPSDTKTVASIPEIFQDFADYRLNPYLTGYAYDLVRGRLPEGMKDSDFGQDAKQMLLRTNTLKRDMRCDIWTIGVDQVWVEFLGVPTSRTRPIPFIESFPITIWACEPSKVPSQAVMPSNSNDTFEETKKANRKTRKLLKDYYSKDSEESSAAGSEKEALGQKLSNNCDKDENDVQYTTLKVADFNIVAKIDSKIRAQLSNPQYLFLMRLIDSVTNFQSQLNADVEDFLKGSKSKSDGESFSIPLIIPDIEFAMVCPYIAELLPFTNPADILSSPHSGSIDGRGDTDSSDIHVDNDGCDVARDINDQQEHILTVTTTENGSCIGINDNMLQQPDNHLSHSQSDSTLMCHLQNVDSTGRPQKGTRHDSQSTEDISITVTDNHNISHSAQYTASDSGLSSLDSSIMGQRPRSSSKLTPTAVKKSFTTGVSNISSFMGKIKNKLDPDDIDDCDSLSLKTDISDEDDFEFLNIDDNEAPAFNHGRTSETSSTTDTDDLSSVFAESTSASRAKEMVSVIVFRLSGTELSIQNYGNDLIVGLQTKCVDCHETGNIIYEDFYAKLSSSTGVMKTAANIEGHEFPFIIKFTTGPCAELLAPKGADLGVLEIRVKNYDLAFRNSSIQSMSKFVEDEKFGEPTPMRITVDDFKLTLTEDRPPPRQVQSRERAPPPTHVKISHIVINSDDNNIFHISTGEGMSTQTVSHPNISDIYPTQVSLVTSIDDSTVDLSALPPEIQTKISRIENQNKQLKLLSEKLDEHSQSQEKELDRLHDIEQKFLDIQAENEQLCDKLKLFALSSGESLDDTMDLRKCNSNLEEENNMLMERIVTLNEELSDVKQEKQSLVSTLQLLQDELMASEKHRHRRNTDNSNN
ncbi:UHRF1 (ICBP90) binding protein 1-like [Mactra antiquata]